MADHPEISIIVAVYNAEDYIDRCIGSIISQTFADYEVILVDDGSHDRSGMICDEYVKKDKRFKAIHIKHGGISLARQTGIDNATGKYSVHIDPDDWIEHDMLHLMLGKIRTDHADICCCPMFLEYPAHSEIRRIGNGNLEGTSLSEIEFIDNYEGSLCNKLIRHNLYKESGISLKPSLLHAEDEYILISLLSNGIRITSVDKPLYHYDRYINPDSLTHNKKQAIYGYLNFLKTIKSERKTSTIKDFLSHRYYTLAHETFINDSLSQTEYRHFFKSQFSMLMKYPMPIHRKISIALSILGLKKFTHTLYFFAKRIFTDT